MPRAACVGTNQFSWNIGFSLQWIIFLISYTYFGSRVVHFKTKFDRLAQMVQELARDICAARRTGTHYFYHDPARQSDLFHLMDCF